MIASMTGYGRAQKKEEDRVVTVEIRAVNHRFLDCSVRAPRLYLYLEEAARARVSRRVSRGKVDMFITLDIGAASEYAVKLNRPAIEQYLSALNALSEDYGIKNDMSVMGLSHLPDVFSLRRDGAEPDALTAEVMEVVDEALDGFCRMRVEEGARLAADIRARLGVLRTLLETVEKRSPQTLELYRARLTARLQEVLSGVGVEENRILAEAALFADRIDVSEETVRFRSHLDGLDALLCADGAIGRKFDFLIQELNREANTIGAKAQDTDVARVVVDMKTEIEKIREQAQNIE